MNEDTPADTATDQRSPTLLERINAQARQERQAAATASGRALPPLVGRADRPGRAVGGHEDREQLLARARATRSWRQLLRCFPRWQKVDTHLARRALAQLADDTPVDPNDPQAWDSDGSHAYAVLRRHGITNDLVYRLTLAARRALVAGQRQADRDAGIDWSVRHDSFAALDEALRGAHAALAISLDDPAVWVHSDDQRRAAGRRLGLVDHQAQDLSRWALAHSDQFDPDELRCWRIASPTWVALADERLPAVDEVERPVACFVAPAVAGGGGWRLAPVLSLELIRLVCALGGRVDHDLMAATLPADKVCDLLNAINVHTLHAGPKENLDSASQLASDLSGALGARVNPGMPTDKRDRWGRILVSRSAYTAARGDVSAGHATREGQRIDQLRLRVLTFPAKKFSRRRLGSAPRNDHAQASATVDLGEAVQTCVEHGLPLLLSTEAAGHLAGTVRVGRMKGKPGVLTITSSDGVSATTRQVVAEQAANELRALKHAGETVTLDAGARQVLRMTLARPLADDAVLLGRQREIAALKVVGSLVDASQVGTGKCTTGETEVLINGGLQPIEQIWERYSAAKPQRFDGEGYWVEPNDLLWTNSLSGDGRMTYGRISMLYRQRVYEPGRRITLDDGSVITVTNRHKLHGLDDWTADVRPGSYMCVPGRITWHGPRVDPAVAELVAWQIAEGYEPRTSTTTAAVRISQKDTVVLDHLRGLARTIERNLGVRMHSLPLSDNKGTPELLIGSRHWRAYLETLGYRWGKLSLSKRVPGAILAADDHVIRVFLRAFFDAEASVGRSRLELTSASRGLIDDISLMLRRLGIWLRVARKVKGATNGSQVRRTYWTGYLGGPSLRRFAEHVGFGNAAKQERLERECASTSNTNVEGVPVRDLVTSAKAAGCTYYLAQPADAVSGATVGRDRGAVMLEGYRRTVELAHDDAARDALHPRIRNTIRALDAAQMQSVAERLNERLEREVFYAKVAHVEEVWLDGWVYDLSVEEHHNYVAGGMLAHNTISTGRALHHRAATTPRFRALVVAEGRLLGQWREELVCGAPARGLAPLLANAAVEIIDERAPVAAQVRQHDRHADQGALVCLVPNSILDRFPADLQTIDWHLLVADEVLRYVNPATEAHSALKQVRMESVADCWLLTATPKGKSAEHLDVLVGLAVGDEAMIAERLNTREAGDLLDEVNAHRLRVNYGPHLVRVTRQDMAAWMPDVRPAQPLAIEPDGALADLLGAIRDGGRAAYRRLLEVVRELKGLEKGSELYQQALVEMSRAQATVLGNVNVFVDASVDPETLTHSRAALAQALVEQGAVGEAMRGGGDGGPLLRGITAQTIAGVAGEEQVIVFAERVWCLRQLAQALNERYGVRAHVADGSIAPREFEALKQGFGAGEFAVLCLSKIGHEGHNLQVASVICHLDMPWVQTGLEQRVGRAARPGSKHGYVQTYIPYIKGGGIEHVISVLADRSAQHHLLLDSFEGVSVAQSTVAGQLGAITTAVAEAKHDAGFAATAARLRVAASVFGA